MQELLKEVIYFPHHYDDLDLEGEQKVEKCLELLETEQLVEIMSSIPLDTGLSFYECVATIYVRRIVTNKYQEKLLLESLLYKRKKESVSHGKKKEKYGRNPSQKKAKGKSYAKVRIKKMNFY